LPKDQPLRQAPHASALLPWEPPIAPSAHDLRAVLYVLYQLASSLSGLLGLSICHEFKRVLVVWVSSTRQLARDTLQNIASTSLTQCPATFAARTAVLSLAKIIAMSRDSRSAVVTELWLSQFSSSHPCSLYCSFIGALVC
jgi:hypothetical protein